MTTENLHFLALHASNILFLIAMLAKSQLVLRSLLVLAFALGASFFLAEGIHAAAAWSVVFLSANLLSLLRSKRKPIDTL